MARETVPGASGPNTGRGLRGTRTQHLLVLCALWASTFPVTRAALQYAEPIGLAGARNLLGGCLLLVYFRLLRGTWPRMPRTRAFALFTALQVVGMQALMVIGLDHVEAGVAATLVYLYPMFAAGLATIFLGERLSARNWTGIGLGGLGVGAIVVSAGGGLRGGHWFMIATALVWALATVVFKRSASGHDLVALNAWSLVLGGAVLVVAAVTSSRAGMVATGSLFLSVAYLSVQSAVGLGLWYRLLAREDASRVSAYLFLVPLLALVMGAVFLHEPFTAPQLAAAVAIGFGTRLAAHVVPAPPGT